MIAKSMQERMWSAEVPQETSVGAFLSKKYISSAPTSPASSSPQGPSSIYTQFMRRIDGNQSLHLTLNHTIVGKRAKLDQRNYQRHLREPGESQRRRSFSSATSRALQWERAVSGIWTRVLASQDCNNGLSFKNVFCMTVPIHI